MFITISNYITNWMCKDLMDKIKQLEEVNGVEAELRKEIEELEGKIDKLEEEIGEVKADLEEKVEELDKWEDKCHEIACLIDYA